MGDRKPSQFLRQLRRLVQDVPDDFLRSIWSSRLPPNVRAILAAQPDGDLDAAGPCADRIMEAAPQPALTSVMPLPDSNALMQRIEGLSRQVAALSTKLTHLLSNYRDPRPSFRNHHSVSRAPSLQPPSASTITAMEPCSYRQQEKLSQRTSTAAHIPVSRGTRMASKVSSTDFGGTKSLPTQRKESSEPPRSPPSAEGSQPLGEVKSSHAPLGHQSYTRPSKSARQVCHVPLYWHTSTHSHHLHSSQTPLHPPWMLCCSNASKTPGSPSPSTQRKSTPR
jgi:hypothetical protein